MELPCNHKSTSYNWCKECNAERFSQYFQSWSSGNGIVDDFIKETQLNAESYEQVLEWIPFEKFYDIEFFAEGGFSRVYSAIWTEGYILNWDQSKNQWKRFEARVKVALKVLNNSQEISQEYINEIRNHHKVNASKGVVRCYGISRFPARTNDLILVMKFAQDGSLRKYLYKNFSKLTWKDKCSIFKHIARGLVDIHKANLVHQDIHPGNILFEPDFNASEHRVKCIITDLGLSKPANYIRENKQVFGILPYIAPEVLLGQNYTPKSDIYAFGIVICEVVSGKNPSHILNRYQSNYERQLVICNGLRPRIPKKTPKLLAELIIKCWDKYPNKRPTAEELVGALSRDDTLESMQISKNLEEFSFLDNDEIYDALDHMEIDNTEVVALISQLIKLELIDDSGSKKHKGDKDDLGDETIIINVADF
ncbi:kinase-like domain-containing protein [Gigaspora rosea]|uniref:Kinase-like domain-containing protein n=1 Tax=Gigaspora rosea TaxID=44941 RepID=A0A397VBW7_9GLOM|nr:kinase-like domain-containing protein [Gigaspora rosea]